MPAYKDEQKGTWYCQFYHEDWQGSKKKKQKRGFKTKREAIEWEQIAYPIDNNVGKSVPISNLGLRTSRIIEESIAPRILSID